MKDVEEKVNQETQYQKCAAYTPSAVSVPTVRAVLRNVFSRSATTVSLSVQACSWRFQLLRPCALFSGLKRRTLNQTQYQGKPV